MSNIVKNTSIYVIGNILPQAIGFLLLPIYTKHLTPTDYGIVSSMQVLATILTIFFTLAVERSIYRLYFDYKSDIEKRDYLGTITISLLFISLSVLLLLFVFSGSIGLIFNSIEFYPFYVYAIFTSFFSVFSLIPKIYFQINEKAGKFVSISILQFLLGSGLVLWFIIEEKAGAAGMLKGKMIAEISILPLLLYISYKTINFKFKFSILKDSLSFSLPMIPGLLSAWILNLSDRIFIERYLDLHDVGIYSLAYKIGSLVLIFSSAFIAAYSPVFYKLANSEDQTNVKKSIFKYNRTYVIMVLIVAFIVTLFSKEAIQVLLDPKYLETYKIVPLIVFAYFISQVSGLFNLMIYQKKKVKILMFIGLGGAVLNLGLNFILIPKYGVYGAAFSTISSFIVIFLLSWRYARNCYFIPMDWLNILKVFFSLLALIIVTDIILEMNLYISSIVKILICCLIGIIFYKKNSIDINIIKKFMK